MHDVIIVGGRPSGASLAARLGERGVRVLIVERAALPSLPGVPSSPILYPSAMRLLDELGIEHASYDERHARMQHFVFEFDPWWSTTMTVPSTFERDHVLGIDRGSFDHLLWENLARYPSVERRAGFAVRDVIRDDAGRVIGVIGGTPEERFHADLVVGADGRFSAIARAVRAPIVEEANEHTSTVYYAEWEDVARPRHNVHAGHVCTNGRGLDVLFFAMPRGRFSVNTHARSDRVDVAGDAERYYLGAIRSMPSAAKRLEGARRVTDVVGIKRIGNGYRQATGPGWALVGDALHYKDPVDGQGIFDALLEARLLDKALSDGALETYGDAVRTATRPMFLATTARLKRELYSEPPVPVIRTLIRWLITDRAYQKQFLGYLNRDVPAERWLTPGLATGAVLRGMGRDARSLFGRGN